MRAKSTVHDCERVMYEWAASCALCGHSATKLNVRISIPRVNFHQAAAKSIVREFNAIAHTKFVKDSVELHFHSSLSDREQIGDFGVVQARGYIPHDTGLARGERICSQVAGTFREFSLGGWRR